MSEQERARVKKRPAWIAAMLAGLAMAPRQHRGRGIVPSSRPKARPRHPLNRSCPCGSGHKYKKCCYDVNRG